MSRALIVFLSLLGLISSAHSRTADRSPYVLTLRVEAPLLLLGIGTSLWGSYRYSQMEPKRSLPDKKNLLPWDRPFAGTRSCAADKASDMIALAAILPFAFEGYEWASGKTPDGEFSAFLVTAAEIAFLQNGMNLLVRSARFWPRPELYRSGSDKSRGEAWGSFYSGHVSAAFSLAVFSGMWFGEKFPDSPWAPAVWGTSLSLACGMGALRIWAGKHYPSDVLAGALAGSLASFVVLKLHRSASTALVALPGYFGIRKSF